MTAVDLALDLDAYDVAVVDGDLQLVTGAQLVRQEVHQHLRTYQSEWFVDETAGLRYRDRIFGRNPGVVRDAEIVSGILDVPEVIELNSYTADLDANDRILNFDFDADIELEGGAKFDSQDFGDFSFDATDILGQATLERTDDGGGGSSHVRPIPGYLLYEDNSYTWHVDEGSISHDLIDQNTVSSDDHHPRYTDAEARAAAAAQISRYKVPLTDWRDGLTRETHLLNVPSGAEVDVEGLGISDSNGNTYPNLKIRVKERSGGTTLVETTDITDPVGYNIQGPANVAVEVENTTGSDYTVAGFVDFQIEFDSGPDEIGRYPVALTDVRAGVETGTHLIHVPSTRDAQFSRAGIYNSSGNTPSGLTLVVTEVGGSDILTASANSQTYSITVPGPATLAVKIDNSTGSDGTFAGFVNVEFI